MSFQVASSFILPLSMGILLCFLKRKSWIKWTATFCTLVTLLIQSAVLLYRSFHEGALVAQMGGWPAPFGITLVVDTFSAMMLFVSALTGSCVLLFQYTDAPKQKEYYHALILFLFAGVNGSFIAGDLFNLYVCFEIMVMSSFVLLVQNLEGARVNAAIRYVTANLFASLIFLTGVGLIYGMSGRLNLAQLSVYLGSDSASAMTSAAGILLLFAFAIKASLFPVYQWLPQSYPALPAAQGALFASLLTKVGVYAVFRISSVLYADLVSLIQQPMIWVATATMLTGVLAAAMQKEIRSILSYHIISQVGYMILGIGIFTLTGFAGAIFYLFHHMVAKSNLFLISAVIERKLGSSQLSDLGGLAKESPWLALSFLCPALALAGIPPFSGFFAKYIIIQGAFEIEAYAAGGIALFVGLITLYSMSKIWNAAFWSPAKSGVTIRSVPWTMAAPVILLSAITVLTGVGYPWVAPYLEASAQQMLNKQAYVEAVLGAAKP